MGDIDWRSRDEMRGKWTKYIRGRLVRFMSEHWVPFTYQGQPRQGPVVRDLRRGMEDSTSGDLRSF